MDHHIYKTVVITVKIVNRAGQSHVHSLGDAIFSGRHRDFLLRFVNFGDYYFPNNTFIRVLQSKLLPFINSVNAEGEALWIRIRPEVTLIIVELLTSEGQPST